MKVAILAGGFGTRLAEETEVKPKPMVEIGGRPIVWHILKMYAHYGFREFVLCLGYKGDVIRDYFVNYELRNCDVTVTLGSRDMVVHNTHDEQGWRVTLAETGVSTLTGGRVRRAASYLGRERFMVTYGDGVADIDLARLLAHHESQGRLATVTAVRPVSRFGQLDVSGHLVQAFREKTQVAEGWINGGFLVFEPDVLDLITGDDESLEGGLLSKLAERGQLAVYQHDGFWQCMDTFREMELLNDLWRSGTAPWAKWLGAR
jgi:glucose-1-phosphate cytidylyltransferase